jgi:hypothetical protein
MKRAFALAALLAAATGCATAENTNTTTTSVTSSPAATATPQSVNEADIIAKEKEAWDAIKRKDADAFAALLADDFTYVAFTGVYDKAQTVQIVKDFEITDLAFSDIKVVKADKDAAVVTYTLDVKGTYKGKLIASPARHSSAWLNRGGKWSGVYHQETKVETPPASQSANANAASNSNASANVNANASTNTNATASVSPAASPTAAPATATEAERQVWDALKRKDWDAFAGFLADDAIEVEGYGVSTKANSIRGVQNIDFSKATLSDFKEMKLDEDLTLVTYIAKTSAPSPLWNPNGERHSTIWARRDGRLQAVFHQGTGIEK